MFANPGDRLSRSDVENAGQRYRLPSGVKRTVAVGAGGTLALLLMVVLVTGAQGAAVDTAKLPPAATRRVDFEKDIRPLLEFHCLKCHGPEKQKSGFRLDQKTAALKGGDTYAPDIRPGSSAESPLIHFVAGLVPEVQMPQKGAALSAEEVGLLRAWIDQGANWPQDGKASATHWSLKPVVRPAVPQNAKSRKDRTNPVDAFVTAKLTEKKLTLSPEAFI